ncbi:MAG: hypothetical protein DRQ98_11900 [Gammaproteobacteria bacterium]|nr:MAG: hypothetical protein DRQ98_11900 [Gammaproteobacteria bacterium]
MATIKFRPNDPAPSDAERTQYNVFISGKFTGYIARDWMDYWTYYVNGVNFFDHSHSDRCDVFNDIVEHHG